MLDVLYIALFKDTVTEGGGTRTWRKLGIPLNIVAEPLSFALERFYPVAAHQLAKTEH